MPTTLVRNNQPGPTVFSDGDKQQVEWQGSGDPNGLDIQPVPDVLFDHVQFQRSLTRGIFTVVDGDVTADEVYEQHRTEWEERQERQTNAGKEALELTQNNDMIVLKCIGPKGHTGENCGEDVTVKDAQRNDAPPLCPKHLQLKGKFLPEESGRIINGKPEVVWRRVSLGGRQRGDS